MIILTWLKVARTSALCALRSTCIGLLLLSGSGTLKAKEPLYVAVATNFLSCAKQLKASYESKSSADLVLSAASTGKLYAQILHGAPYDVFLSADSLRPQQLVSQGMVKPESVLDYAIGEIVIWHPGISTEDFSFQSLFHSRVTRIAIANPKTAPYGLAAQQFLTAKQALKDIKSKIVRGENVSQAAQFVRSGNAQIGIVAKSMLIALNDDDYTPIEQTSYEPITQQLALLSEQQEAKDFISYLINGSGKSVIEQCGYELP